MELTCAISSRQSPHSGPIPLFGQRNPDVRHQLPIQKMLDQITICSLDDELENIIKMDYKPQSQNIFSYLGDLRKAIKRLNDINERLPDTGRIILPDSYIRSRLVRAARQVPIYKPVLNAILISDDSYDF